ncbi:MAG: dihydrolipoamide acetyltransferase family protein [Dehalococcoidia bacterium]|nr:dihydrolipoamide acetyltransferase family protein [Dehalococcoidia bacterium]MDP7083251.1 dihydrolipoamide acetyltransferase family protein [Dehalococcoidia bacterium]MDP7200724.1 dihydrolipoamide acetyltransferase family protein [Dehalococcoidia bacterium]MDP7510293.1 dihydrolipoamide acetyltransferase family protein [Dehalococcoidia bacterium]HJN87790.1 dihydrolipoamide acetyltransferase family protein [Dehalococcoidia bacterium]
MAVTIELPHVGESVIEGTIGQWLKQPGDTIERYEPLVEVITDKVTMEVPSPVGGVLLRILAQEGETLPMGAPIAEVETDEIPVKTTPVHRHEAEERPAAPAPTAAKLAGTTGYLVKGVRPVGPTGGGPAPEASPEVPQEVLPETSTEAPAKASTESAASTAGAPRLSPAVRRLVQEHGVDLTRLQGTGLGGRITRDDVQKYLEAGPVTAAPTAAAPATPSTEAAPKPAAGTDEEHIPLTPVRRMIAEALTRSASQIPHAWSTVEADITGLVALRTRVRDDFEERERVNLTYLPFVVQAVAESLKEHPSLNASWGGDKIILKKRINVGIAVAAPQGLIVPVIHDAERLSVAGLARAIRDLTNRARQQMLTLDDVQGGTFTLNNTGALGSVVSQPIINYPQAGILTTEAILKRAVVRDDAIAIRSMMNLCLSFDHRINDGAESSAFMQAVKTRLESMGPDTPIY